MISAEPNFDRVARVYRWAEYLSLGPILQQTRTHFIPYLRDRRHVLLLGDGDGRFLARLLQQNQHLTALAVDTSAAMLQLLCHRCHFAANRLTTRKGSALNTFIPPETDLVVTHFLLDCLTQPDVDRLTSAIVAAVQPGALWLVSDFQLPRSRLLRPFAFLYIRALYLAFRILTGLRVHSLPNPQRSLTAAGFTRIARHQRLFGLLYTELWRLD